MDQRTVKHFLYIRRNASNALLIFCFAVLSGCSPMSEERQLVSNNFKDPESTKFRNEKKSNTGHVCGEYNSKNSYGAYVGYKRYIAKKPNVYYTEDGLIGSGGDIENFQLFLNDIRYKEKAGFEKIWNKYCQ